jgi:8-oxo-dGTP pyrophosphatase MutT (NUDIX family)
MNKKGPFDEISRTIEYENPWIRVEESRVVRPDGSSGTFGLVFARPGVTVVALDDQRNVLLVREYKLALERETIELVSGAIEDGEAPEAAALRELKEETGYSADSIEYLGVIDPFTSVVSGPNHLLLASGLSPVAGVDSGGDIVVVTSVPLAAAVRMVENSEITHGASCVALLRTARRLGV